METMKVALVTASSAGLGAAIAKHLATDMRVVINYFSTPDRADAVLAELSNIVRSCDDGAVGNKTALDPDNLKSTPRFYAIRADVSQRSGIQQLVSETIAVMGRLDIIVSNCGWTNIRNFADLDDNMEEEDWDRCFNINVKSHLYLLHAAKDHLEATAGSFTTIASVAGVKPSGSSVPYAVTKAAQIYLVKCLAGIVGPKIRVNSVSPGILMTDWGRKFPEERLEKAKDATVLKRFATLEDVAKQVKLLAMSDSMTGVNVVIDSGFSMSV